MEGALLNDTKIIPIGYCLQGLTQGQIKLKQWLYGVDLESNVQLEGMILGHSERITKKFKQYHTGHLND